MGDTRETLVNVFGEKGERMSGGTNAPTWHPGEGVDDGTIISQVKEISTHPEYGTSWIVATDTQRLLRIGRQAVLQRSLKNVEVGDYILVTYEGERALKSGKGKFKQFIVRKLTTEQARANGIKQDYLGVPTDDDLKIAKEHAEAFKASQTGGDVPPRVKAVQALKQTLEGGIKTPSLTFVGEILTEVGLEGEPTAFLESIGLVVKGDTVDLSLLSTTE